LIKMKGIRINRYIALCGLSSRREAEKLILSGRVKINGRIIKKLSIRINPKSDKVEVDGKIIEIQREKIYLMLNKPFGYICSRKDPMGRHTIYELLNGRYRNLFSIGRLDFDSLSEVGGIGLYEGSLKHLDTESFILYALVLAPFSLGI